MKLRKILSVLLAVMMVLSTLTIVAASAESEVTNDNPYSVAAMELDKLYAYDGDDLGSTYTPEATTFKVWSPTAENVVLKLYATGSDEEEGAATLDEIPMTMDETNGVWSVVVEGDLLNVYYTYEVTSVALVTGTKKTSEVCDIYAKAVGVNGNRAMVVDLDSTDPEGWENDQYVLVDEQTDAIVWEVVVRDFSNHESSGVSEANRGKFLAFTEKGTTVNGEGNISTCVDYLKELGVTHVQINPFYDFASIQEDKDLANQYNWGYDPKNYNVPEGSYSSNPYDGNVRIKECKQMIQALHEAGIGVIMDVVYNHTYASDTSFFQLTVPNYYYRFNEKGGWVAGSGCGNDTASERAMFRKFMLDSCRYWVEEYHVDGFRFDLMGLHDAETMNQIRADLDTINPKLIMYGEGWNMTTGFDPVDCEGNVVVGASQTNAAVVDERIGMFNDQIRDALKGNVFTNTATGFLQGSKSCYEGVAYGIRANTVGKGGTWTPQSANQCVTYVSCHDNHTLYDRLVASTRGEDAEYRVRYADLIEMNKMSATLILTSQGTSFFVAGEELARSKDGDHNSYSSPVEVNEIDWNLAVSNADLVSYYRGLIDIRKNFAPFSDGTGNYSSSYKFATSLSSVESYISYVVTNDTEGQWEKVGVMANSASEPQEVTLPDVGVNEWVVIADNTCAGVSEIKTVKGNTFTLTPSSSMIVVDKASFDAVALESNDSKVIVNHVDAESNKVITTQVITGEIGKGFETAVDSSLSLEWEIDSIVGETKGVFTEADQTVTYNYIPYVAPALKNNDLTDDGKVTIKDATAIQKYLAKMIDFTEEQVKLADYDYNGQVSVKDTTTLQKHLANMNISIGTVVTNFYYINENGDKIAAAPAVEKKYKVGAEYDTEAIAIELYELKETPANAKGVVAVGTTNVNYIYNYAASGIKVHAIHLNAEETWVPFLWAWDPVSGTNAFSSWPGVPMMEEGDGWFTIDAALPEGCTYGVIINNNGVTQTADMMGNTAEEIWIVIDDYNVVNQGEFITIYTEKPDMDALRAEVVVPAE